MSNNNNSVDESDRLRARRERMSGGSARKGSSWRIFIFIIAILLFGIFVVFPDETRRLLGLGTSSSEDIQRTSRIDNSGISTQIESKSTLDIEARSTLEPVVPAPIQKPKLDLEAAARIAALEKSLSEIANRPANAPGPTAADIKKLLDQQAIGLRREAEAREKILNAQLAALQARQKIPSGPSAEALAQAEQNRRDAGERARLRALLEKKQADRKAELEERRISDGNIYDGSEEGKSTSGTAEDKTGVRELSGNEKFLASSANAGYKTAKAADLGDISKLIVQGTIIQATLETAIDTELPGNIRAQVTTPVYSFDGQSILMPAGTRLIGTYNSKISIAQQRVLISWVRAITPEGKSVHLAATGTDRLGRAGQNGNVDTRFLERFGTAVLISSISAIPSFLANDDATGNTTVSTANDVAQDASGDLKDATEDVLKEYLSLPPIIRIPQGTLLNVLVNQDLDFS